MIDKEDLKQWETLPGVANVLTSAQMGAWLYYREENMRKRIREQAIDEFKKEIRIMKIKSNQFNNPDYITGYVSALSTLEGYAEQLKEGGKE